MVKATSAEILLIIKLIIVILFANEQRVLMFDELIK